MNYDRSSNPIFQDRVFEASAIAQKPLTVQGVIQKSSLCLLLLITAATFSWHRPYASVQAVVGAVGLFSIISIGLYFVSLLNQNLAKFTVPLYAITEGLILGAISSLMDKFYPGVVVQAITGTLGVFAGMLLLYRSGLIKVNDKFAAIIFLATLGVAFTYLANWIMCLFGGSGIGIVHSASNAGIIFSTVICVIAALNLLLDFEYISRQAKQGVSEKLEWISALGLLVTLIWIYLEIVNLLIKLRQRD